MIKKLTYSILAVVFFLFQFAAFFSQSAHANPDPGLQLEWKFDEGLGTTPLDSSGNGNVGTLYNGPTYVSGIENTAISLNGTNQYAQVDSPFAFLGTPNQDYALSAWVNVPNAGESGNIIDLSSNIDGSGWCIPFLSLENGAFSATSWDNEVGGVYATDSNQAQPNQWYQVLTTWDPTNGLRLFVNGTLVQSTPQPDYAASGVPMYFAVGLSAGVACTADQGYLDGSVDDVRLYDSVITSADVQDIYSVGTPPSNSSGDNSDNDPVSSTTIKSTPPPDTGFGEPTQEKPSEVFIITTFTSSLILIVIGVRRLTTKIK